MEYLDLLIVSALINVIFVLLLIGLWLMFQSYWKKFVSRHIERRETLFEALPLHPNSIVFLGDSITESANWGELLQNPRAINRGIASDTTEGVLGRIDQIYALEPSSVFLMIGINDLNFGIDIETIIANYDRIFDGLDQHLPNSKIYLQSVLPVNKDWVKSKVNKSVPRLNKLLLDRAQSRGYQYIDIFSLFTDDTGHLKSSLSNDGIHLLGQGYTIWRDAVRRYVDQ
jgi:lysophospholipase L1-like esterase